MSTVAMTGRAGDRPASVRTGARSFVLTRFPYLLSGALAATAALAAAFTVSFPSLLHGAAVSNGNLRGTAVVLLAVVYRFSLRR